MEPPSKLQKSSSRQVGLCLVGFGNANKAFAQILLEKRSSLPFSPVVVALVTGRSGWLVSDAEAGVDLTAALQVAKIADLPGAKPGGLAPKELISLVEQLQKDSRLDVLVEAIPTNHSTGEPALGLTEAALRVGVSVVTANKAPVAIALDRLLHVAKANQCCYLHEAACMDGIPIFNLARHCLPHAQIVGFDGILNSTTNVILNSLENDSGLSFEAALKVAQDMGIAEADPSADIDGWDAAVKCVCLARALGLAPAATLQDVKPVEGIRSLDGKKVVARLPERYKLLCQGRRAEDGTLSLSVTLGSVDPTSPLHGISGASSCVTIFTDVLGPMTIVQKDPTTRDTGYGLFADLCEACKALI